MTHIADLIESNLEWLRQSRTLLDGITDKAYSESPAALAPQRVGAHLRHILEFYECFLEGVQTGVIDYDARARSVSLETSRRAAREMVDSLIRRLERVLLVHEPVLVCADGAVTKSSTGRELQTLGSHTVHHFALIALHLRVMGIPVERGFGMAPSTLRYLAGQARKEAA